MADHLDKPLRRADFREAPERCQPIAATGRPTAEPAEPDLAGEIDSSLATADPPEIESLILDRTALERLRVLDGGEGGILHETINLFLDLAPGQIERLSAALANGDFVTVELLAHTLKSSSRMLGGQRLTEVCTRLERVSRDSTPTEAPELVKRIRRHFADLRSELAAEMARNVSE